MKRNVVGLLACVCMAIGTGQVHAQSLRFSTDDPVHTVPTFARFRTGPVYSGIEFAQSVGYSYSVGDENAVDVLHGTQRGAIEKAGSEVPMSSTLNFLNYVELSQHADMDLSILAGYMYYPLDTQEDEFFFNLADETVAGDLKSEVRISPVVKMLISDRPAYATDFIDSRGRSDQYGGRRYERFENDARADVAWLMKKNMDLILELGRSDVMPSGDAFGEQRHAEHRGSLCWEYEVYPNMVTGMRSGLHTAEYPKSDGESNFGWDYLLFANSALTKHTKALAGIGYSVASLTYADPARPATDSSGVMGNMSLSSELTKKVDHSIAYSRSLGRGFESGLDTTDNFNYHITWNGDLFRLGFFSGANMASEAGGVSDGYSDLQGGVNASCPITRQATLSASSAYSVRKNKPLSATVDAADVEAELKSDYTTWVNRVGVNQALTRSISADVYASFASRQSDDKSLEYDWFITGVNCTYKHQF